MTTANGPSAESRWRLRAARWRVIVPAARHPRRGACPEPLGLPLALAALLLFAVPPAAGASPQATTAAKPRVAKPAADVPRMPDAPLELLPAATPGGGQTTTPRGTCLDAARRAEKVHGLPEGLLVAIALSESGLHAHALSIGGRAHYPRDLAEARRLLGAAGPGASVMAGCVQVNARVHARGSDWPLDAVRSADWAGGILRRWHSETGSWAEALRRWHGGSAASSARVLCRVRAKLEATAPGSPLLAGPACSGADTARLRQTAATLLQVAEADR